MPKRGHAITYAKASCSSVTTYHPQNESVVSQRFCRLWMTADIPFTMTEDRKCPRSQTLLHPPGFSSSLRLPKTSSQSSLTPRVRVNSRRHQAGFLQRLSFVTRGSGISLLEGTFAVMLIVTRHSKLGGSVYIYSSTHHTSSDGMANYG